MFYKKLTKPNWDDCGSGSVCVESQDSRSNNSNDKRSRVAIKLKPTLNIDSEGRTHECIEGGDDHLIASTAGKR